MMQRAICTLCLLFTTVGAARAGSITMVNTTDITAYQGNSPVAYFGGANPYVAQSPIGTDFTTSSLTIQTTTAAAGVVVDFRYLTQFSGTETLNGQLINNADIFLNTGGGYGTPGFTYAISLGDQSTNGGLKAGFYSVGADATSQDIWSSRPAFIFGGAYGSSHTFQPGQPGYSANAAPTVLTAGQYLSGASISEISVGQGWYQLDAKITMTASQAAMFANGIDVFWGTGDCANGAFLADFSGLPMPEPCSAAILISGLFYLAVRRKLAPGSLQPLA